MDKILVVIFFTVRTCGVEITSLNNLSLMMFSIWVYFFKMITLVAYKGLNAFNQPCLSLSLSISFSFSPDLFLQGKTNLRIVPVLFLFLSPAFFRTRDYEREGRDSLNLTHEIKSCQSK